MTKIYCSYCGVEVYKQPSQIKNSKSGKFYCDNKCKGLNTTKMKREEIELRIGQDLEEYLYQKYVVEKKTTTWIMEDAGIHSHYLNNSFKEFGIEYRSGSESFEVWWDSVDAERRGSYVKDLSIRAKKNLNSSKSRDNLRETMQTKDYKDKMSKANSGKNNGMYDPTLSKDHRVETRALFGYKKWAMKVKERDSYTCQNCSIKGNTKSLHAHHINDYYEYAKGRMDLNNAVTLCSSCHSRFHNENKGKPATKQLLDEFMGRKM